MKTALCNLICCEEVLEGNNLLEAFSMGLLNFHNHYCKDQHDSPWCKFQSKINDDGSIPIRLFKIILLNYYHDTIAIMRDI